MSPRFEQEAHLQFASFFAHDPVYPFAAQLYEKLMEGHICIDLIPSIDTNFTEAELEKLQCSAYVSYTIQNVQPFIVLDSKLYLYKYLMYEESIISFIQQNKNNQHLIAKRYAYLQTVDIPEELFDTFADVESPTTQIDWQFIALVKSFINRFSIITGGPGTGKTTTIAKLLRLLLDENKDLKIALAAPTGKAAIRMKEALLANANYTQIKDRFSEPEGLTIHRLLGAIKNKHTFKHNKHNQLQYDVVIIDEASMVDLPLMSKLIEALPTETRLILLGDQNQLSAVGAGSLLKDLCDNVTDLTCVSANIEALLAIKLKAQQTKLLTTRQQNSVLENAITQLQLSRRFSSTSEIGKLSTAILSNGDKDIASSTNTIHYYFEPQQAKDFVHIDINYNEDYINQFVKHYIDYITEPVIGNALAILSKTRILCAVKESDQGVFKINQQIESKLASLKYINQDRVFYENMPIMITQNNPELRIYNGDIGIIRNGLAHFGSGDGEVLTLQPALLTNQYQTVFAMTIHKSQGSEFDNVLVILPANLDNKILTKQLLYTGVTRAKKRVIIQSTTAVLQQTLQTEVTRISGISNRLKSL